MRVLEYLTASRRIAAAGQGRSIRFRLLAIALLPTLVILPLLLGVAIIRWNDKFNSLLATKVNSDLTTAHQYFARILDNTVEYLRALGASASLRDAITTGRTSDLSALLEKNRAELKLDFLMIIGADGRVIASTPALAGTPATTSWPVVRSALAGSSSTAVDIFSGKELGAISPELAQKAELELIPTPAAVPTARTTETRGMVVHAACPVTLASGERGALVGGTLLNRNLVFIDTINDLVYREASLPKGSQGTATLFLDDVRISTNVRLFQGERALGTRVSSVVRSAVLDQGRTWLDSAFVVNDWYMSAYEPITDSFGQRVGMLYVGFLQAPFVQAKYNTLITIIVAFLAVAAVTIPIFLRWAHAIFEPLERMTDTIARVEGGDLGARTGPTPTGDEIGRVAHHLDGLLDQLQQRDRELRSWNEELNHRVAERTQELELANRQLEAATKQLIISEKLAAIGEITAGVAHEINNPIAVIQGNLEVLRSIMGECAAQAKTEFRLLDEQIYRISQIVAKLLQFAKPEEYAGYVERHRPREVISDCLPLVQHLLGKSKIEIRRDDRATRFVSMNKTELQQVMVNLIVNAIHAMPDGGTLTLTSSDETMNDQPGVIIEVTDTGIGMTDDVQRRIFDPFFTTKRDAGTGLGLSISRTLISRQSGTLTAVSALGKGTTFTIWLPEAS